MTKYLLPLLFILFAVSPLAAQDTFAPLITDNTIAVIYADLRGVKLDTLKAEAVKQSEALLKQLNFDSKSAKTTLRELNAELNKIDPLVRPIVETVMLKLGINEIAVIFDQRLIMEQNAGPVVAVPWKNKTKADLQTLIDLMPEEPMKESMKNDLCPVGDFLVFLGGRFGDKKTMLNEWYKELKPAKDGAVQQALKSLKKEHEIKFAAALTEAVKTKMAADLKGEGMPAPMKNLLLFISKKVEWAAGSVSFADLLTPPEGEPLLLTVKTPKAAEARQLRLMLEGAIDWGIAAGQFAASTRDDVHAPPLFFELGKGFLRTLLPDVEEDRLLFRLRKSVTSVLGGYQGTVGVAGVGVALLLPAVQAAREAARRAQCQNQERQLVLALHNYTMTSPKPYLPALYTKTKEGKPLHSWRVQILPFIEQQELYRKIRQDEPWDSEHNKQFHNADIPYFRCPNFSAKPGECCYIAAEGLLAPAVFGTAKQPERTRLDSFDDVGTANMPAIYEVDTPFCWMDPTADTRLQPGSKHERGVNVTFLDARHRTLSAEEIKQLLKTVKEKREQKK